MLTERQQAVLHTFQRISETSITREQQIQLLESDNWNLELALLSYREQYPQEAESNLSRQLLHSTQPRRDSSSSSRQQRVPEPTTSIYQNYILNQQSSSMSDYLRSLLGREEQGQAPTNQEGSHNGTMPGAFPDYASPTSSLRPEPSKLHQLFTRTWKGFIDGLVYAVVVPFYVLYKLAGLVMLILVGYVAPMVRKVQQNRHYKLVRRQNDPTDVARRFAMEFDEMIGNKGREVDVAQNPEFGRPDFLECAYSQALYMVKKEVRWLLLYVHSNENGSTQQFIETTLLNKDFLRFIRERNFLCWGGDIKESESFQVVNQFKVNQLPFLGLLCLTVNQTPTASGVQNSPPVLSLVCKIQGCVPIEQILARMTKAYNKFNPTVASLHVTYEKQNQARLMRQLQDQAYQDSLQKDRERKLEKERKKAEKKLKTQWHAWRRSVLRPEETARGEYARVAIRLPDGSRKQFKFSKHCSLEEVYAYVECVCLHSDTGATSSASPERPEGFHFEYPFRLVSAMPRKELDADESVELADCDVAYPSGNLVVENN